MAKGTTATAVPDEDLGDDEGTGTGLAGRMGAMLGGGGGGNFAANLGGVDLSKASTGFELLPENTDIRFTIEKCVPKKAANSGNMMLQLGLRANEPGVAPTVVADYVVYQGDNPWKFKSLCQATGLLSEDGSKFIGESERDFIGQDVIARVQHDVYQGDKRNKIKGGYKPLNGDDGGDRVGSTDEPDFG